VKGAVEKARRALSAGGPVLCLHELVHNKTVVGELKGLGMLFVESLSDVPDGGTILFSAHGVPPRVRAQAAARGMRVIDATCPFVARAHRQVQEFAARGVPIVVVGDAGHVEVVGLVGEYEDTSGLDGLKGLRVVKDAGEVEALPFPADRPVGVVCQTTLSSGTVDRVLSALRARYPRLVAPPAAETCTATRDRQAAVRMFVLAGDPSVTGVLVIGSATSANTARLAEIAREAGATAWRVDGTDELSSCDFNGIERLGLTAGASTPEAIVMDILSNLSIGKVK
jgi:4-hydroxy-3-methylbut-2-enyl diphosphate reductase